MNIPTTYPTYNLYEELPEPIYQEMKTKEAEKVETERNKIDPSHTSNVKRIYICIFK